MKRVPRATGALPFTRKPTINTTRRQTMSLLSSLIQQRLDADFPIATEVPAETYRFPPSTIHPSTVFQFPGVTHESTNVVRGLMEENDRRFHIYQKISCR